MTIGIAFYHEYSQPIGVLLIVSVILWPKKLQLFAIYLQVMPLSQDVADDYCNLENDNSYFSSHRFYLMLLEKHLHSHIVFINTMINTCQCNWFPLWFHVLHFLCVKGTYNSKQTGTVGLACPFSVHTNLVSLWISLWPNKLSFQNIRSHSKTLNLEFLLLSSSPRNFQSHNLSSKSFSRSICSYNCWQSWKFSQLFRPKSSSEHFMAIQNCVKEIKPYS